MRQSLYNFKDVINGGKNKAETAAAALKRIQPTINAQGHSLRIPMPGHSIREEDRAQTLEDVAQLDELVKSHDAVMLLLDTREARWLPTVMAAAHDKVRLPHQICFSVALGFDNFIVIRHGGDPVGYDPKTRGTRPGCYFCNDYLSPTNTMRDRSLDQQCTVTRPGLSFISSAYASELLVNLVHLKQAHIDREQLGEQLANELGLIPQHIRGSASGFNVELMCSESYDKYPPLTRCLACGAQIVQEYRSNRDQLVLNSLANPAYLQDASGIKADLDMNLQDGEDIITFDDNS